MNDIETARAAYAAYGQSVGWKNYRGDPMPEWDALPEAIRHAWIAACLSVVDTVCKRIECALNVLRAGDS